MSEIQQARDEQLSAGYAAVWASGLLTMDVYTNARIWRAVETALNAAVPAADERMTS
ncbi:hypothetical protein [Curtobacterium sp. MCBD17_030]|uniref:hypothetical protein n=1 Tax=Curtobacterium sp. MCBD17_030 TaxID=2175649 RepID=UPI0015E8D1A6|nr:hypothetical protein [Curtobacterium sp. MCBD17_030]